jgi:antitoxin ChpS
MHTTNLRKVGGSVMLAVPPAILDQLEGDQLILKPQKKPKYTLEELLAGSDYSYPMSAEDREWIDAPPVGRELI